MWSDRDHRECRMAATMLYPPNEFSQETALEWARGVENSEIADVLCHRLLRKLPFALELADQLLADETPLVRYTAFRLLLNLLLMGKATPTVALRQRVEKELARGEALLRPLLASLQEELADATREMA
ncbi:MAG: DNA alkylation repair protein [Muribaculaceae bacterium]|nr:DNA alkylation repair protein [Muribaculaceae bacterium]